MNIHIYICVYMHICIYVCINRTRSMSPDGHFTMARLSRLTIADVHDCTIQGCLILTPTLEQNKCMMQGQDGMQSLIMSPDIHIHVNALHSHISMNVCFIS